MPEAERAGRSHLLTAGLGLAVVGIAASALVLAYYGGGSFWPGLVTGFLGTLVAFVLALAWERERDRRRLVQEADELQERRATEVRRRLEPVRAELQRNAESLDVIEPSLTGSSPESGVPLSVSEPASFDFSFVNPQLLEGAWTASAPRLSELVADYKLIADLATAYGRIEELRWRLRYRTEHRSTWLDTMTVDLVDELRPEISDLIERVAAEIKQPTVQPLGLAHVVRVGGAVDTSASLETKVLRGDRPAP
jgi:hypothetical protein